MQLDSIGQVIATRALLMANDEGRKILVRMGMPQPLPEALGDDHFCPYQITGIGGEKIKVRCGRGCVSVYRIGFNDDRSRFGVSEPAAQRTTPLGMRRASFRLPLSRCFS
jgi:hypothetical protein